MLYRLKVLPRCAKMDGSFPKMPAVPTAVQKYVVSTMHSVSFCFHSFRHNVFLAALAEVWMGGKNTSPGTFEQLYDYLKHHDVEIYNRGFQQGGFAMLKTTNLDHAWWYFDWLKIMGIYTGRRSGPVKDAFVSVSVSPVMHVPVSLSCSWCFLFVSVSSSGGI